MGRRDMTHEWVTGPDGTLYHCRVCGISKCDDHDGYSCLTWLQRRVRELEAVLQEQKSTKYVRRWQWVDM